MPSVNMFVLCTVDNGKIGLDKLAVISCFGRAFMVR